MFPPVCFPYAPPQLPDLRQPGPALREKVAAGLLLSFPAAPTLVVLCPVALVFGVRADRRWPDSSW